MSNKVKEIEAKLLTVSDPIEKVDILNDLSQELRITNPHRGLETATQANKLSRELSYSRGLAGSHCYMGTNYIYLSEFNKAVEELGKALIIFNEIEDKKGQAVTLNWTGNAFHRLCDYPAALQHYIKGLRLNKELGDIKGEAGILNNIGNIYSDLGEYETCLDYYFQSLQVHEKLEDKFSMAINLNGISLVYKSLGDYKNALEYQIKSYQIKQETGNRYGEMMADINIGNIYFNLGEFQKALDWYHTGLKLSEELGEQFVRANSLNGIGQVFQKLGESDQALEYFKKSLPISQISGDKNSEQTTLLCLGKLYGILGKSAEEYQSLNTALSIAQTINSKSKLMEAYQALSEMYERRGDYPSALEHFGKYHEADKELFNESSDKKRQASMIKFQVEQKEKEAEIYRLRNVELAEANQAITQAKEIIEEKNRHITSSIEYARRIQQAVLPPAGKMQAALPEHFVLFKPRDIVSGDFYWFTQTGGKTLIAVVDCTGHGVPGAFMSMIGSMLLNTIVNENGETGPAKVLEQLHVAVRTALKQHDAEADTTDGMDVCLCAIEQGSKRLLYAGAKRPLYLVRGTELTEIAGDGKSIGGRQKEEKRAFSDKQIELQDGDMLYLTSDGYSDQCNPEGRKIGSRRLKELLVKISGQDPSTQRDALLTELTSHQGNEEQRDDIAIIGIGIS